MACCIHLSPYWNALLTAKLWSHPLFGFCKHSMLNVCWWNFLILLQRWIQWYTSALYALSLSAAILSIGQLLSEVKQKKLAERLNCYDADKIIGITSSDILISRQKRHCFVSFRTSVVVAQIIYVMRCRKFLCLIQLSKSNPIFVYSFTHVIGFLVGLRLFQYTIFISEKGK